jgi:hypothetical protein
VILEHVKESLGDHQGDEKIDCLHRHRALARRTIIKTLSKTLAMKYMLMTVCPSKPSHRQCSDPRAGISVSSNFGAEKGFWDFWSTPKRSARPLLERARTWTSFPSSHDMPVFEHHARSFFLQSRRLRPCKSSCAHGLHGRAPRCWLTQSHEPANLSSTKPYYVTSPIFYVNSGRCIALAFDLAAITDGIV